MRRNCRFSLLILLIFSMLLSVSCGGGKKKTDFIYKITDGYAVIVGYSGIDSEITIPKKLGGKAVKKIEENAFRGMVGLKKVTIPDTVTEIDYAFIECPDLVLVELGDGIKTMNGAFKDCPKLETVIGGKNATELSEAFMNCASLTSGYIPQNATACASTFRGCKALTDVKIEEGITALPFTFEGCASLKQVMLPTTVTEAVHTFENCTSLISVTGCTNLTVLENTFAGCTSIPHVALGPNVKILKGAFIGCTSLMFLDGLPSEVESYSPSFSGCIALTEMVIPKMAESEAATYDLSADTKGCAGLEKVTVNTPFFVTGEFCTTFAGCSSLKEVNIPDEAAEQLLRVGASYEDRLFTGSNSKVTSAVNKYKKASNVRITVGYGFVGDTGYTYIFGGDVNYFDYESVAKEQSVIGFETFTKSYYWCGYPNGTNRKSTTVALEREYTFYVRVTGGSNGELPYRIIVNGMECIVESN